MKTFPPVTTILCTLSNFSHKLHTLQCSWKEKTYVFCCAYTNYRAVSQQRSNMAKLYRDKPASYLLKQLMNQWLPLTHISSEYRINTLNSIRLYATEEETSEAYLKEVVNAPFTLNLQEEHMIVGDADTYSFDTIPEDVEDTEDREYQQWQENRGQVNDKEMAAMIASSEAAVLANQFKSEDKTEFAEGGHPSKLSTSIATATTSTNTTNLVDEL